MCVYGMRPMNINLQITALYLLDNIASYNHIWFEKDFPYQPQTFTEYEK